MRKEYLDNDRRSHQRSYSIGQELKTTHQALRQEIPELSRISIALFDPAHSELRTFVHSTIEGSPLVRYRAPISPSTSLGRLVCQQKSRVVNDIASNITADSPHSTWLLEQGYAASLTLPILEQNQFTGLLFFDVNKPQFFDNVTVDELTRRTKEVTALVNEQSTLIQAAEEMAHSVRTTSLVGERDNIEHAYRVGQYAHIIADHIAPLYQLDDETIDHIVRFACLHDIGKYSTLSSKQCSLWLQDWDNATLIAGRVQQGVNLINQLARQVSERQYACTHLLGDIIRYHHEYLNGTGYPFGLKHAQIPIAARIVTVANIFDALTSHRHYSESWSLTHALLELEKMVAQGQLDGNCVHPLRCHQNKVKNIMLTNAHFAS
ncbi:HD domain-containing phosphohydrolase [Vibrio nomapromontoriensis]|uniref:HD domain-containing phosphohydrolase n=1 Tax=Vibrio nomapromontoriensis TaxID=2910246 RepID=UPI003D0F2624